jgi:hypothetical protein
MLRRFILALNTAKGLQHPDPGVRLLSIEFLGPVVTQIVADAKQVRACRYMHTTAYSSAACK